MIDICEYPNLGNILAVRLYKDKKLAKGQKINGQNNQNQEEKKYVVTFVDENNNTIESKEWKEKYPEMKKLYPKASIMDLLYVFAKKMKQN